MRNLPALTILWAWQVNKAVFADYFAERKEAGFALVIFTSGAASGVSFFMLLYGLVRPAAATRCTLYKPTHHATFAQAFYIITLASGRNIVMLCIDYDYLSSARVGGCAATARRVDRFWASGLHTLRVRYRRMA